MKIHNNISKKVKKNNTKDRNLFWFEKKALVWKIWILITYFVLAAFVLLVMSIIFIHQNK